MSGKDFIKEHLENKEDIFLTCFIFHLDISGNSFNEEHSKNIL